MSNTDPKPCAWLNTAVSDRDITARPYVAFFEPVDSESPSWVRLYDERAIAEVRRKMMLDLWDALPGHEKTGDCAGSLRAMLLFSDVGDEIRETRLKGGPA